MRTEYLLWEISEPGAELLGAVPDSTIDIFGDPDFGQLVHFDDPSRLFDNTFDPGRDREED